MIPYIGRAWVAGSLVLGGCWVVTENTNTPARHPTHSTGTQRLWPWSQVDQLLPIMSSQIGTNVSAERPTPKRQGTASSPPEPMARTG